MITHLILLVTMLCVVTLPGTSASHKTTRSVEKGIPMQEHRNEKKKYEEAGETPALPGLM